MNNLQESIRAASDQIKQAVQYEEAQKPEHALECYRRGVARFRLIIGQNRANRQLCETLEERLKSYQETTDRLAARLEKECLVDTSGDSCEVRHNGGGGGENSKYAQSSAPQQSVVLWEDIEGLGETKRLLRESVILPRELPQLFTGIRRAPHAILLYGPPGNGKTQLVRALASEMTRLKGDRPVAFYAFTSADIISKYVGESARNMRELFVTIKANKPCIIFIDEIDSICSNRRDAQDSGGAKQALNEFLVQLDGICEESMDEVLLLGATNLPGILDGAMLRRMAACIYVPMPDAGTRRAIFARLIGQNVHALEQAHFDELGQISAGYSASDITNVCADAAMLPVRRLLDARFFHRVPLVIRELVVEHWMPCGAHCERAQDHEAIGTVYELFDDKRLLLAPPILFGDLLDALARHKPTVSQADLDELEKFTRAHGQKS